MLKRPLQAALGGAVVSLLGALGTLALAAAPAHADVQPSDTLLPCPYGYLAQVCASEINPGFEFIPVDGPLLFTGETVDEAATVHTIRVEVEIGSDGLTVADALATIEAVLNHPAGLDRARYPCVPARWL